MNNHSTTPSGTSEHRFCLLYDSQCPLCVAELQHLKRRDKKQNLILVDVHSDYFKQHFPELTREQVLAKLHGFFIDRHNQVTDWVYGLDATYHAWRSVGLGFVIKPLRWPLIRWVADAGYRFFARHRTGIAKLLTGKAECQQCRIEQPSQPSNFLHKLDR